jgi:hypothetical protein
MEEGKEVKKKKKKKGKKKRKSHKEEVAPSQEVQETSQEFPQEAPKEAPQEDSKEVIKEVIQEVPQEVPQSSQPISESVPQTVLQPPPKPKANLKTFLNQNPPREGEQWTDDLFPPNENSLKGNNSNDIDISEIEWKRANEILPEPHLFEGEIKTKRVINGRIGIPYYLSSISALCDVPGLITKIFITKDYNPNGFYSLLLFIDGEYQIVYIDDYFPCLKGTNIPYFTKPNNFALWPMILEKAWAKINGSYGNSLSGWPSDLFRAFTGFCCEDLPHNDENSEKIFNIIKKAKEKNAIICSSSKNDEEIIDVGLIGGTTYTLLSADEVEDDKNRKVFLLKLRNDFGKTEWNGDWSEKSLYWNDHIKNQIPSQKMELKEGEFFIGLKDYIRYFSRTDICHLIFNGVTRTFEFDNISDISCPHIFNFYLGQKGNVSVSVSEKNWRYNRELMNVSHPTSIIMAEYEPGQQKLKYITGTYESFGDAEKTRELNPGYYIVWVYKGMNQSEKPLPESMKVRIISEGDLTLKYLGPDNGFDVAEQIVYYGVQLLKEDQIKDDAAFYDIASDFKGSGLGYRLIINPLKNAFQKWEIDTSSNGGYYLLSEFENPNVFNFTVNPNDFETVLFIRDKKYGTFNLNIKNEVEQENCDEDKKRDKQRREFDSYCLSDLSSGEKVDSERTPTLEELSKSEQYPESDNDRIFLEKNKTEENKNLDLEQILKLEPPQDKEKLGFVKIDNEDGVYLGEADYATPQGRGSYVFKNDGQSWIGYFENGEKGKYGQFYDKDGRLTYEGEYSHGERNGKGKYYYPNGSIYEGDFVRNKKEGFGIYHWDDKTRWEGTWVNDKMDGPGVYYEGENSTPLTYSQGNVVNT